MGREKEWLWFIDVERSTEPETRLVPAALFGPLTPSPFHICRSLANAPSMSRSSWADLAEQMKLPKVMTVLYALCRRARGGKDGEVRPTSDLERSRRTNRDFGDRLRDFFPPTAP